jgi:hypothetical protein
MDGREGRVSSSESEPGRVPGASEGEAQAPAEPTPPPDEVTIDLTEESDRSGPGVDEVQGEEPVPRTGRRLRWRKILVGLLVVLTTLAVVLATFGVWIRRTVLDTDHFVALVAPLGTDPKVTSALSTHIAQTLVVELNLETRTRDALPDQAAFLAAPITGAVQNFVQEQTNRVLSSPGFERLWTEALRRVHSRIVSALRGESTTLIIENEQATLNILPLFANVIRAVDQRAPGLIEKRIPDLPDVSGLPPDQARAELSSALGVQLSPDFGEVVVYEGSQLTVAQNIVKWLDRLPLITIGLVVLLAAAALLLSLNRRRTLVQLGLGIGLALFLARALIRRVQEDIVAAVQPGQGRSAAESVVSRIGGSILTLTLWVLVIGLVVMAAAFLAGRPQWFRAANRGLHRAVGAGRGFLASDRPAVRWARAHSDGLRLAGVIVAVVAAFLFGISWVSVIVIAALLAVYLAGVGFVARGARGVTASDGALDHPTA